jgi:hypothetical protein
MQSRNFRLSQCLGSIFDHAYPVEVVGLQGLSISQPLWWTETLMQNLGYFVKYIQIIITISKQVPNKNNKVYKVPIQRVKLIPNFKSN